MNNLDPVIIDGKVIGLQWEHIWFIEREPFGKLTEGVYSKGWRLVKGVDGDPPERSYTWNGLGGILDFFDTEIENLVNL